ncbi:Kinetochore protein Spc24 [Elasticomyces elasticus]|nr:Kinetochore protein Spc24 [Elasticomyces elasticus]KAK3636773.1 Kinetochore protein Spc24 [Elasticomyces elasticus]KAK4912363.1 Kinetochore protein Spc24 [Elasticomyces elasticus]KAK5751842.1 Kinetochore protein Spc24 [Elasticomyces elasticus]
MPRPAKRAKLIDAITDDTEEVAPSFTINADFAARFEHNKKREEKARLEEKYGSIPLPFTKQQEDEEDEESTDESEDDDAELVDLEVDQEISATLEALRRKDPRIYDEGSKFYKDWEGVEVGGGEGKKKEEKPMFLHDYHRRNLLAGHAGGEEDEEEGEGVETYQQEQEALKRSLVGSMHDAVQPSSSGSGSDNDDEDGFLVKKTKPKHSSLPTTTATTTAAGSGAVKRITESDIASASHDPETYLSNFMAARAWIAPTSTNSATPYAALDEDDSEEDSRADKFEEAFNLRFEDPNKANEVLMSFQRDAGANGVRREEMTGRKKAREREKERKEAERREREGERARLRKLMVDEAEEKVRRIKEAAGLRGKDVDLSQWRDVIEGDFEDEQWDLEMKRRFGDEYYDEAEGGSEEDEGKGKGKVKKPKWEDDIDIKDLVPEFEDEEEAAEKPKFALSDEEDGDEENNVAGGVPIEEDGMDLDDETPAATTTSARTKKKSRESEKTASKRAARSQRAALESLIDAQLPISHPSIAPSLKPKKSTNLNSSESTRTGGTVSGFRYRQASPTFFGLTAKDVLFAEDAQLNEYVGLKKMHSFRDGEKKRRDKKRLSKKARLREWRKATFGREEGARQEYVGGEEAGEGEGVEVEEGRGGVGRSGGGGKRKREGGEKVGKEGGVGEEGDVREGERRKKRKRSGKGKKSGANAVVVET